MNANNDFSKYVTLFFTDYLTMERGVSPNTLRSYASAFAYFLDFMRERRGVNAEKLKLEHVSRKIVLEYLVWIESTKGSSVSTRNQRLAAIHSFCRYMLYERVDMIQQWQEVLGIRMKKTIGVTINYLSLDGIKALFDQIPQNTAQGRRDLAMLSLLYETGARVQELVDLRPIDINLTRPCYVTLFGKGNKKRIVPIQDAMAKILRSYMEENDLFRPEMNHRALFQNTWRGKLTTAGVSYVLKNYAAMARAKTENLIPDRISPHCFRHSKAMHLLQADVDIVYIRDILGHVSLQTTQIYAKADSDKKRKALQKAYEPLFAENDSEKASWEKDPKLKKWLKGLGKQGE